MDDALALIVSPILLQIPRGVLILVVMDDALARSVTPWEHQVTQCLNPCCNG